MPNAAVIDVELSIYWIAIAAGSMAWVAAVRRLTRTGEIVAYEGRRPVPWDAVALLPVILVFGGALFAAFSHPDSKPLETPIVQTLAAVVAGQVVIFALQLGLTMIRGAQLEDLGFSPRPLVRDLKLGVLAFIALAPVVFAIQQLLVRFAPSKHAVQEMLERDASPVVMGLAVLTAVIVAPLVEEFMFRVVLQGWLEKVLGGHASPNGQALPQSRILAISPILLSAAIFASLHLRFHDGIPDPDPIPLFVLALGLGYLYRQTHRIWPSLVVHVLLNGCSMAMLLVQLFDGPAPK